MLAKTRTKIANEFNAFIAFHEKRKKANPTSIMLRGDAGANIHLQGGTSVSGTIKEVANDIIVIETGDGNVERFKKTSVVVDTICCYNFW